MIRPFAPDHVPMPFEHGLELENPHHLPKLVNCLSRSDFQLSEQHGQYQLLGP
jgi:hypothetical protein